MAVNLDPAPLQAQSQKPQPASPPRSSQPKTSGARTPSVQNGTSAPAAAVVYGGLLESNVTFRRDGNGQIYYVVTDAKSGKELRQVPAEEIRRTGQGIAEYLKRTQEKATSHVEVKA